MNRPKVKKGQAPKPRVRNVPDASPANNAPVLGRRGARRLQSMSDQIAERIFVDIVVGQYAPGERIREEELAQHFGVSRGPIREALRILEKDAVVRLLPNRGASVTELSIKEVNHLFEIRKVLAGAAIRALAPGNAELVEQLEKRVAYLEALAPAADAHAPYVAGTSELALDLAAASGNERLAQIMESLARQSSRYTQLALTTPERRKESARNWRAILKALAANKLNETAQAMEKLIDDARREAVRLLENAQQTRKQ